MLKRETHQITTEFHFTGIKFHLRKQYPLFASTKSFLNEYQHVGPSLLSLFFLYSSKLPQFSGRPTSDVRFHVRFIPREMCTYDSQHKVSRKKNWWSLSLLLASLSLSLYSSKSIRPIPIWLSRENIYSARVYHEIRTLLIELRRIYTHCEAVQNREYYSFV